MRRWLPTDAAGWRSLAFSAAMFTGLAIIFIAGARLLGPDGSVSARRWLAAARGPWALPGSILIFAVCAFAGVPQLLLIAAAVVVFGPLWGAVYSWAGTQVSSAIGFAVGRLISPGLIDRAAAGRVARYAAMIARNAFWATVVARLAPVAPFVLVNLAGGASGMALADYLAGTAVGTVPKIALTALAGRSTLAAMNSGRLAPLLLVACAAALWIGSGLLARRLIRRPPG